ncbi:MAG: GGDEF domain-containing phosphodiesterase [Lachnospiraceae bacterium]|nr:GGDEF domain-containing phosphodiesterase [Lachnospiraceae bacterium]
MIINKLNQLYKPKRVLYYTEASEDEIEAYFRGLVSESVAKYTNTFGSYDYPGVFYVASLGKEVIGIEFRLDDERVDYPKNLKSIVLPGAYFYSVEIDNTVNLDREYVKMILADIANAHDAHRLYSDLSVKKDPYVMAVFEHADKARILYEMNIDRNYAPGVIEEDPDSLDKSMLYKMALFDPITGHGNWNHLLPYIEMPMDAGISDYAFAHFDVKSFRVINEVYGHIAANKVLKNIVDAMNSADFIYASGRCHNDNFAMLLRDMPTDEMIGKLEEFFAGLSTLEEDPNYKIFYKCGVVPMQRSILSGNRVADAAKLAQAMGTSSGKTDIIIYTDKMHEDIMWGSYIKAYLETAIENDEFVVYLQPKFDIDTEKVKGAEALVRWNYKNTGILTPYRFVPFFEKDGSIGKIDDIVLRKVCEAFSRWKKEGMQLYPISVNLSRNQLYDSDIITHLTEIVDSYDVDHELIDFELTESATYDNMEQMIRVLGTLRERGFKISMDDFGTGYSSLSLLTQMPLDTLKIDKSFVDKVGSDNDSEKDTAVIRHIISLAKELDFVCLAEGAELKTQVDKLRILGCEVIQGYYYSKPIPMSEYEEKYL